MPSLPHWSWLRDRAAPVLGAGGLLLWAYSCAYFGPGRNIGLGLMALAAALQAQLWWPRLRSDPYLWVALAFVAYAAIGAVWAAAALPGSTRHQHGDVRELFNLCILTLPVAWWLRGDPARARQVLLLAFAGLLVGISARLDWNEFGRYVTGAQRLQPGISPNGLGLYAATALLGFVVFSVSRVLGQATVNRRERLVLAGGLALAGVSVVLLMLSQSRSAWVAAAVVLPPTLLIALLYALRARPRPAARALLALIAIAVVGLGVVSGYAYRDTIQQRFHVVVEQVDASRGAGGHVTDEATYARLQLWELARDKWLERPVFGWGPGSARHLIRQAPDPRVNVYKHFHNLYLHVLVTLGLAGAALATAAAALLACAAWRSLRSRRMPPEFGIFLLGYLLLFLVASLFTLRHDDAHGRSYLQLLAAVAYTFWLWRSPAGEAAGTVVRT